MTLVNDPREPRLQGFTPDHWRTPGEEGYWHQKTLRR